MKAADADLLFIPGWSGAEDGHWQTRWRRKLSTASLVDAGEDAYADLRTARQRIVEAIRAARRPVLLIAHGPGVAAVAHAAADLVAQGLAGRVAGAFLVAPPADDAGGARVDPAAFPYPTAPLPFPSLLVASRNDPHGTFDAAGDLALAWGSSLVDAGEAGHIDAQSGHGPWPEGLMRLAGFLGRLAPPAGGAAT